MVRGLLSRMMDWLRRGVVLPQVVEVDLHLGGEDGKEAGVVVDAGQDRAAQDLELTADVDDVYP